MEEEKKEQNTGVPEPEDWSEEDTVSDEPVDTAEETDTEENDDDSQDNDTEDLNKDDLEEIDEEIRKEEEEIKEVDEEIEKVDEEIEKDIKEVKKEDKEEPSDIDETQALIDELMEEKEEAPVVEEKEIIKETGELKTHIFALRTTANREDQVMDFLTSNAEKKKYQVYSVIRPHGMRGYIFVEAESKGDAEQAAFGVPYARGLLPNEIEYKEIEHMLEQVKKEVNIQQNDIVEIISGPFKRENAKIIRLDKSKEEVVVELLEAAVPIPITLKMDAVKVIRRDTDDESDE
ncbi:transcription elongation factor Spt5 [Candidatus Woesearchaeota archaeon]|nr:transcription elongation factor Spt5 [Candidatus Woesearchaeota archaeon]